ncbi:MAG: hypothetical protein ACYDC8_12890 [Gammaproteobacteria bacterium]
MARALALTTAGWLIMAATAHAGSSLQVYAVSAAGESQFGSLGGFSCSTFAPNPEGSGFFSPYAVRVGVPTDSPCGVGQDKHTLTTASGPIAAASTLSVGFGSSAEPRAYVGNSAAHSNYGVLGARAAATYNGSVDSGTVIGSEAFGYQQETLTIGGGVGSGTFRPTFTIDGSLSQTGRGYSQLMLVYGVNGGPGYLAFRLQETYGTLSLYGPGGYVSAFPGMTIMPDGISGSTSISFDIPFTFGTPFDFDVGLWASVLPSSSVGQLTASGGTAEFNSTAKMTGIAVLGNTGPVTDFTINSGSGTQYNKNGVSSVPIPGSLGLLSFGLAGLGFFRRKKM